MNDLHFFSSKKIMNKTMNTNVQRCAFAINELMELKILKAENFRHYNFQVQRSAKANLGFPKEVKDKITSK